MKIKKILIIDTSVAVKWVNRQHESNIKQADKILEDFQNEECSILMPELSKYELGSALLYKKAPLQTTLSSLATYYHIPIQFVPQDEQQAKDTIKIAHNSGMTYYDAAFISLAKAQKADLITDNPKHQGRYKGKDVRVISLKDYGKKSC